MTRYSNNPIQGSTETADFIHNSLQIKIICTHGGTYLHFCLNYLNWFI